ncbi:MAG TPA: hypothetical protein EYM65_07175 [Dehalococcoidia bacterium]|nr:hypothetical protein [Dehalococcoidia bacterium]
MIIISPKEHIIIPTPSLGMMVDILTLSININLIHSTHTTIQLPAPQSAVGQVDRSPALRQLYI